MVTPTEARRRNDSRQGLKKPTHPHTARAGGLPRARASRRLFERIIHAARHAPLLLLAHHPCFCRPRALLCSSGAHGAPCGPQYSLLQPKPRLPANFTVPTSTTAAVMRSPPLLHPSLSTFCGRAAGRYLREDTTRGLASRSLCPSPCGMQHSMVSRVAGRIPLTSSRVHRAEQDANARRRHSGVAPAITSHTRRRAHHRMDYLAGTRCCAQAYQLCLERYTSGSACVAVMSVWST